MGTTSRDIRSGPDDTGRRLDRVVRRLLANTKLGEIYALLRKGDVRVNGKRQPASYRIKEGDVLQVPELRLAESQARRYSANGTISSDDPLHSSIIFENDHLLCFNKPRGIQVHGRQSLDRWVRSYLAGTRKRSLSFRPGPVHRLDRNTSGVIFFGKTTHGSRRLTEYIREGKPRKIYLTVLDNELRAPVVWEDSLSRDEKNRKTLAATADGHAGVSGTERGNRDTRKPGEQRRTNQKAVTAMYPILWSDGRTLALCTIRTGRTHQIRAQAALHGHPLSGDVKYGGSSFDESGYILHALAFLLPDRDESIGLRNAYAEPPVDVCDRIRAQFGAVTPGSILESVDRAAEIL